MILLFSDRPDHPVRDPIAYAEMREDAWSAWREIAPGHVELAVAFAHFGRLRMHARGLR